MQPESSVVSECAFGHTCETDRALFVFDNSCFLYWMRCVWDLMLWGRYVAIVSSSKTTRILDGSDSVWPSTLTFEINEETCTS